MAATTTVYHREVIKVSPTRQRVMGIIFLVLAFITWFFLERSVKAGVITSFGLNAINKGVILPEWRLETQVTLLVISIICAILGGIQLARGFKRYTNFVLAIVVTFFVFAFLTWAAAGQSLNLAGLLYDTLSDAVPLVLAALSGVLSESGGVVNIAIEGMMLMGACSASFFASISHSLWIGMVAGLISGILLAWIHGYLSIHYKVNQIVSGTIINIFATGLTSYISTKFLQVYQNLNDPGVFKPIPIPGLVNIPVIGTILFYNNILVYIMFLILIVVQVALLNTVWGLRMRAVGEHPKAADTLGVNVIQTRYMAVLLSGAMAGFAGAYFTIGSVGRFDSLMTGGRGFIGLAAMIFGNYTPVGAFGAGLLFGFADSLASKLAILGINVPSSILLMIPYIATMIVLAGVVGGSRAPAADGVPYTKE
ncbi:MAG TPA: ABC transporter permease [Anaerolineaceae bacterium]|nr:ABC transporter permease [Anaerolineaceae bacterium]